MENIETQEQTIYIESWTLIDFALALEEAFYNGYEVSDKNEYAPIQIGGCYTCTLVKTSLYSDKPFGSAAFETDDINVIDSCMGESAVDENIVIPQLQPCVVQQDEVQSETQQEPSEPAVTKTRGRKPSQK